MKSAAIAALLLTSCGPPRHWYVETTSPRAGVSAGPFETASACEKARLDLIAQSRPAPGTPAAALRDPEDGFQYFCVLDSEEGARSKE